MAMLLTVVGYVLLTLLGLLRVSLTTEAGAAIYLAGLRIRRLRRGAGGDRDEASPDGRSGRGRRERNRDERRERRRSRARERRRKAGKGKGQAAGAGGGARVRPVAVVAFTAAGVKVLPVPEKRGRLDKLVEKIPGWVERLSEIDFRKA